MVERLENLAGVKAAAYVSFLPNSLSPDLTFDIPGSVVSAGSTAGVARWRFVSPRYFEVLDVPALRGRTFTEADTANSMPVVVINKTMARKYWGDKEPIGQRIRIGNNLGPGLADVPREIVGIIADTREDGLNLAAPAVMYLPQAQMSDTFNALTNSIIPAS